MPTPQDQQTEDDVRQMMRKQEEPGLQSVDIAGKGKGVVNTKVFSKGDYVCEYAGELMSKAEGMAREKAYAEVSVVVVSYIHADNHHSTGGFSQGSRPGHVLHVLPAPQRQGLLVSEPVQRRPRRVVLCC